jgi:hypothetical protein
MGSFAGVALLLSNIGIYGVMGFYVQQHLKDISVFALLADWERDVDAEAR